MNRKAYLACVFLALPIVATAQEPKAALDRFGDPLPANAIARLGTVRFRDASISHVKFSPDGTMLATYGHRGTVSLWDAKSGRLMREIDVGAHALFTANGKHVVCQSAETIRFHDVSTGKLERSFKTPPSYGMAVSSNGKQLATKGNDKQFHVFDADTGEVLATKQSAGTVDRLEFSSDGKSLAIWNTYQFELWDTEKWQMVHAVRGYHRSGKYTRDPNLALFVNDKHVMTLWDIRAKKAVHEFKQDHFFYGIDIHPTEPIAVSGSPYGFFAVWDLKSGKQLRKCQTNMFYVWEPAFSGDGKRLAVCSNGGVEVWDTATWKPMLRFDVPDASPHAIGFLEDGKEIVSLHEYSGRTHLSRWDSSTTKEVSRTPVKPMHWKRLSANAKWLAGHLDSPQPEEVDPRLEGRPGSIAVWELETGKVHWQWELPKTMRDMTISSENDRLVVLHSRDTFTLFDLATGKMLKTFEVGKSQKPQRPESKLPSHTSNLVLSPHAEWLAGASGRSSFENSIVIWNTASGKREFEFAPHGGTGTRLLLFSPADRSLACAVKATVEIWEPYSSDVRRKLEMRSGLATAMAYSPDGRQFATGHFQGDVHIWDLATEKEIAHFKGHRGRIAYLKYSHDGKSLASASADTSILIWKSPELPKRNMPTEKELESHWESFTSLNARTAYSAMLAFRDHPDRFAPFFEKRLGEHAIAKLRDVPKWIADLDSADFKVREHAFKKLQDMGPPVRPQLKAALEKPLSLEARRRYEQLLELLNPIEIDPDAVLVQRIHELAQMVNTPEVKRLLPR